MYNATFRRCYCIIHDDNIQKRNLTWLSMLWLWMMMTEWLHLLLDNQTQVIAMHIHLPPQTAAMNRVALHLGAPVLINMTHHKHSDERHTQLEQFRVLCLKGCRKCRFSKRILVKNIRLGRKCIEYELHTLCAFVLDRPM